MAFRLNAKLFSPTEALFDAARATSKGIEAKGTVEVEGLTDTLLHRNCDINEEEERRGREGVVGDDESTYETKSDGQRGDR
ncbi:hypothetical protein HZH66_009650 [Vespula vulgaris]|uniref:Uncharacterized protein n=1 Tax=Vespula vulgaris TaxID=7454 RepID=A0A834MZI2_VESVU|nr:hypothetical protein HZH66_009650 [Vespula vulgaris]